MWIKKSAIDIEFWPLYKVIWKVSRIEQINKSFVNSVLIKKRLKEVILNATKSIKLAISYKIT